MSSTKIKICGIRSYEDAKLALDLGADALGFNFYPKSRRYISPGDAQTIVRRLPPHSWFVGIFVNEERKLIEEIARRVGLDSLQFHGEESPEFCSGWKEWRILKALRLPHGGISQDMAKTIQSFADSADFLLFDSFPQTGTAENLGGTGIEIDKSTLDGLSTLGVFAKSFLAGGLNTGNVSAKIRSYRPLGVDVASGVEGVNSPGKKDPALLEEFIQAVRKS